MAELALRRQETLTKRNLAIISRNLKVLDQFFDRHPDRFQWQRPAAGPIAFPRLLGKPVEPFCHALVKEAGVLLLPGTLFEDQQNHFRIGFGRENLPDAVARLENFLQQL